MSTPKFPFPPEAKEVDVKAYLFNVFTLCGCMNLPETIEEIKRRLKWFNTPAHKRDLDAEENRIGNGALNLVCAQLDAAGLLEHGGQIFNGWLTHEGKALLAALEKFTVEEIDEAHGEAYDGLHYGGFT